MQFIDLAAQYKQFKSHIDRRIQNVLNHGQYIMGPEVAELESELASYVGVKHAITCANGTDALTLSLMALDIEEGDAVFVPTFTFFATAEAVAFAKATPVFVDSDESTFNICPVDLEIKIQNVIEKGELNPKAIIPVDLFGLPANYPAICSIAKKYNLKVIEDSAQGFGGSIQDIKAGSFGDISTTSFFPAKPLGCYGDGGAVFTDNDEYAALIRSYRMHGKGEDKYDNVRIGLNSRLDTIQAAILLEKLSIFPQELTKRNQIAEYYESALSEHLNTPKIPQGYISSWAQYTLVAENAENRSRNMNKLKENNLPSAIYYRTCMHRQSAFNEIGHSPGSFPVAEKMSSTVFSLPMHPYLSEDNCEKIVEALLG